MDIALGRCCRFVAQELLNVEQTNGSIRDSYACCKMPNSVVTERPDSSLIAKSVKPTSVINQWLLAPLANEYVLHARISVHLFTQGRLKLRGDGNKISFYVGVFPLPCPQAQPVSRKSTSSVFSPKT